MSNPDDNLEVRFLQHKDYGRVGFCNNHMPLYGSVKELKNNPNSEFIASGEVNSFAMSREWHSRPGIYQEKCFQCWSLARRVRINYDLITFPRIKPRDNPEKLVDGSIK